MGYIPWQTIRVDPGPGPRANCLFESPYPSGLPRPAKSLRGANTGPRAALVSDLRRPPVGAYSSRDEIAGWVREVRILRRCYRDDKEAVGWIDEAIEETEKWLGE